MPFRATFPEAPAWNLDDDVNFGNLFHTIAADGCGLLVNRPRHLPWECRRHRRIARDSRHHHVDGAPPRLNSFGVRWLGGFPEAWHYELCADLRTQLKQGFRGLI